MWLAYIKILLDVFKYIEVQDFTYLIINLDSL